MDVAYVSAISALAGSVIGGLTSGYTTWLTQRSQARAGMVAHDLARREDLIRDFIVVASKMYGDALVNSEPKMPEIVDLYAMVRRMSAAHHAAIGRVRGGKGDGTRSSRPILRRTGRWPICARL